MKPRTRHVWVGSLLAIYIVWPLVHQQLVLHYRINPWKFAGWAMYSTMQPRGNVVFRGLDERGAWTPIDPRPHDELMAARARFMSRRLVMGLFVDPSPMAAALARALPQFTAWEIEVNEVGLSDPAWIETVHRSTFLYGPGPHGVERKSATYSVPPATASGTTRGATPPDPVTRSARIAGPRAHYTRPS